MGNFGKKRTRIAIHQPNFVPWLPYFYKMAHVDIFVLLNRVQFEKNGYQNRFMYKGKWITKPVEKRTAKICDKKYVDGINVAGLNDTWIRAIKGTLGIDALLIDDSIQSECKPKDATDNLIDLIKAVSRYYKIDDPVYVTNSEAKDKYLDEENMRSSGVKIEYLKVPKVLQVSTFEALEIWGIEGTRKQLCRV